MSPDQLTAWLARKSQPAELAFEKPLIMGVLNVTPDSFFDGGSFFSTKKACDQALKLIDQGADLLDIGGESTRPGATPLSLQEELDRVLPLIEQIRQRSSLCISIDTYKPQTMEAAVQYGANLINDIYSLSKPGALAMAKKLGVPVVLMHMQGQPQTMQDHPVYPQGVMKDLLQFFEKRLDACEQAGLDRTKLILDPGFGFGKSAQDNLHLLYKLENFKTFNCPLLLGVSRKSTIGSVLNKKVEARLIGGISLAVYAALKGVNLLRTHDVDETKQAFQMLEAISQAG